VIPHGFLPQNGSIEVWALTAGQGVESVDVKYFEASNISDSVQQIEDDVDNNNSNDRINRKVCQVGGKHPGMYIYIDVYIY
jgi:hypothetical protein